MLRRLSALIGMVVLVAILIALVWAVHEHRARTDVESVEPEVRLDRRLAGPEMEGESSC